MESVIFLFILPILFALRFPATCGFWVAPLFCLAAGLLAFWLLPLAKRKSTQAAPPSHASGSSGSVLPAHAQVAPPPSPHPDFLHAASGHVGAAAPLPSPEPVPQAPPPCAAMSPAGPLHSGGVIVGAGPAPPSPAPPPPSPAPPPPPPPPPQAPWGAAVLMEGARLDEWQSPAPLPGAAVASPEEHFVGGARAPAPPPEAAGATPPRAVRAARVPKLVLHIAAPKQEGSQALDEAAKRIEKFVEGTYAALKREDARLPNLPHPSRGGWPYTVEEAEREVMSFVRGAPPPALGHATL